MNPNPVRFSEIGKDRKRGVGWFTINDVVSESFMSPLYAIESSSITSSGDFIVSRISSDGGEKSVVRVGDVDGE